jgi:hypothetical protein
MAVGAGEVTPPGKHHAGYGSRKINQGVFLKSANIHVIMLFSIIEFLILKG